MVVQNSTVSNVCQSSAVNEIADGWIAKRAPRHTVRQPALTGTSVNSLGDLTASPCASCGVTVMVI